MVLRPKLVEAWLCPLPLPWPVRLGSMSYHSRDYVAVRITDDRGVTGSAIGYTRGTPLLQSLRLLAECLPSEIEDPVSLSTDWGRRFAPGWGSLIRAASLIDICLWDISARVDDIPLGRLIGAPDARPSLMAVGGYFVDDRGVTAVVDEAVRFAEDGFAMIKVMLSGVDPRRDEHLLTAVMSNVPDSCKVAVDLHGQFRSMSEARRYGKWIDSTGASFVEDPFPSSMWRELRDYMALSSMDIASGEDLIGDSSFKDLLDIGVPLLRADATASGGISALLPILEQASDQGTLILPHVWPHVHAHLSGLAAQVAYLEVIPPYVGADPMWDLLEDHPTYSQGHWVGNDGPGVGLNLDDEALGRFAAQSFVLTT